MRGGSRQLHELGSDRHAVWPSYPYQSFDQTTREDTIDDIIAQYGPRVPDSSKARRDFRLMTVIVTRTPLAPGDWDYYRWQLQSFRAATAPGLRQ